MFEQRGAVGQNSAPVHHTAQLPWKPLSVGNDGDDTDCGSQAEPSETRECLQDQIDVVVLPPPLLVLVSPYTIESNTMAGFF